MFLILKKIHLFFLFLCATIYIQPVLAAVQKIDEDFYLGGIPGTDLRLVMERVSVENIESWRRYAEVQASYSVDSYMSRMYGGKWTRDGSALFKSALSQYPCGEMWVAYITKTKTPEKIKNLSYYNAERITDKDNPSFVIDIEMFMTVTSSPNALITTHLGISQSVESMIYGRTKGTSVDLHSFAAKVMLERNPERKESGYMVNPPVFAMEKIIADALPGSVFVGTREMQKMMEERKHISYEDFSRRITQEHNERIKSLVNTTNERFSEESKGFRSDYINRIKEGDKQAEKELQKLYTLPHYITLNEKGKFIVLEEEEKLEVQKDLRAENFKLYKNPFVFVPEKDSNLHSAAFLEFMKKHPPILSVDNIEHVKSSFTIFNHKKPTKPWLTVNEGQKLEEMLNNDYRWMFMDTFKPQGVTHYMVVDLQALANSRGVELVE